MHKRRFQRAFLTLIFMSILKQGWGFLIQPTHFLTEIQEANSQSFTLSNEGDDLESASSSPLPLSPPPLKSHNIPPTIEFKAGYFFFSDAKMRNVYDKGGLDLQISGSYPVWRWIQIYGSVEYFERHGRSLGGHQKTSIWAIPLSLGPKLVARIHSSTHYYFTIGPRYFFVHAHNHSSFVDKTINQNGIGGFVGTGFNFFPSRHFLIDVFGEYSYCRLHFHPSKKNVYGRTAQVGGFAFGAGLGYAF